MEDSSLKKLLLSNSAHEVRTPLNAIINYLEIALEGPLDQETRDSLTKSHSASKSLVYVINDLLDLTRTEEGQRLINDEAFDFLATIREAVSFFKDEAKRKGIEYELIEHAGLPQWVFGDQRRVRQAFSNLIANAIDSTATGWVRVELWLGEVTDNNTTVEVVVQDSGAGMSNKFVEQLFRDLEQVSSDDTAIQERLAKSNQPLLQQNRERSLGLGLAVVARMIRNMNGQLRLKSTEGQGSRFIVQLPFSVAKGEEPMTNKDDRLFHSTSLRPVTANEITLVDNNAPGTINRAQNRSGEEDASSYGPQREFFSKDETLDRLKGTTAGTVYNPEMREEMLAASAQARDRILGLPAKESSQYATHENPDENKDKQSGQSAVGKPKGGVRLRILVAEDDPINNRILKKRLERSGHEVHITVNGQECVTAYQANRAFFDVILMDMQVSSSSFVTVSYLAQVRSRTDSNTPQMPIVDGSMATQMIRTFEEENAESCLSDVAITNGRVPVLAVSASLVERDREQYIKAGFDGWVLKPIDFQRLSALFGGIVDDDARKQCLYRPGEWECGGWFERRVHL